MAGSSELVADSARTRAVRAPSGRWELQTVLCTLVLALVAFLVLYPLVLLLLNSFEVVARDGSSRLGLDNWTDMLAEPGMRTAVFNSSALTLVRQLIAFPVGVLLAWLIARTDLPGRDILEFLFWIAFFLPTLGVTLGWILLFDPQYGLVNQALVGLFGLDHAPFNIYSWWGIIWAHVAGSTVAVKVMLLTPAFRHMDTSLEESSRVVGASTLGTLLRIVVPLMLPALLVVFIMATIRGLEAFEVELILGGPARIDVFSTKIYRLLHQEPPFFGSATALAVMVLIVMLPFIILQWRVTTRGHYATVTGKFKGQPLELGPWRWPAFALVAVCALVVTVVPLTFLAVGTFMKIYGFFGPSPWTLGHWQAVLGDAIFLTSLRNTFVLALGSAGIAVLVLSIVAYITVRTRFWGRGALDLLTWLPFTLPGIILGLGYLWMVLELPFLRPLYGSTPLLILVVTVGGMTLGVQIIKSNMVQLDAQLEEVSWSAGASWWYTYRHVVLPLLIPALIVVGLVTFISAARAISHIALLVSSANRPLAMLQLEYLVEGRYEAASVVGLIVVIMTIGVALVARVLGFRAGLHV